MSVTHLIDLQTLWDGVSKAIKESIPESSFNTWLSAVHPIRFENNGKVLVLGVPNELTRGWIQKNYQKIIISEITKTNQNIRGIKLTISRRSSGKRIKPKNCVKSFPLELNSFDKETNLNPDFTFEEFVVAPYNRFAYTAAQVVIEKFGMLYNPFYIYGPTGVGKTHLLQAIGNKIKKINPSINMYYTTGETFTENYINAIKKDRMKEFRSTYQSYQLFILDDVHFLERRDATLIEMFHLFNTLINKNAQIILSSDRPPSELDKMEDRIKTRLNSGVVIDIQRPEYEDMRIVCAEKAEKMGLNLTKESITYIIEKVSHNIREIGGALKNIHLHNTQNPNKKVDIDQVKNYIKNHVRPKTMISYNKVIDIVCEFYNLQPSVLSTKIRKREVVHTRQIIMYIFREHLNLSYSFIGKCFGDRDHTTVMHGCEKIQKGLQENSIIQKEFNVLMKKLNI